MIVLGIDPGQTGGFAQVSEGQLLDAWPMPLEKTLTKKPTLDFWCAANAGWKGRDRKRPCHASARGIIFLPIWEDVWGSGNASAIL